MSSATAPRSSSDRAAAIGVLAQRELRGLERRATRAEVVGHGVSQHVRALQVSLTQDRHLGRKLVDREAADVVEKLMGSDEPDGVD